MKQERCVEPLNRDAGMKLTDKKIRYVAFIIIITAFFWLIFNGSSNKVKFNEKLPLKIKGIDSREAN